MLPKMLIFFSSNFFQEDLFFSLKQFGYDMPVPGGGFRVLLLLLFQDSSRFLFTLEDGEGCPWAGFWSEWVDCAFAKQSRQASSGASGSALLLHARGWGGE